MLLSCFLRLFASKLNCYNIVRTKNVCVCVLKLLCWAKSHPLQRILMFGGDKLIGVMIYVWDINLYWISFICWIFWRIVNGCCGCRLWVEIKPHMDAKKAMQSRQNTTTGIGSPKYFHGVLKSEMVRIWTSFPSQFWS